MSKYTAEDDKGTMPKRKRDLLIVKVVDWSDDDPDACRAYDVETYVNGEFVPERSTIIDFGKGTRRTQEKALDAALKRAQAEVARGI